MEEFDQKVEEVSEDTGGMEERVVPVGEAIRYRRRAQQAEKELARLQQELEDSRRCGESLARRVESIEEEQELRRCVAEAGAKDIETAVLVVKSRLGKNEGRGSSEVIEQVRKEKGYLFDKQPAAEGLCKTLGVRQKASGQQGLDIAAKKAAKSGARSDLLEYQRARRRYV